LKKRKKEKKATAQFKTGINYGCDVLNSSGFSSQMV
jgi:hypothetical protein